ncbi:MAG TPA: PDZ domain-containing protein [Parasegetibacter sp.]
MNISRFLRTTLVLMLVAGLSSPLLGQEKESGEEIIIRKKGDAKEKLNIVIEGDKVTVNGKPLEEYKGDDIKIMRRKSVRLNRVAPKVYDGRLVAGANRGFLGVLTEKADGGAQISEISDGSPAEKAGLKKGDIITMVEKEKISSPEDLSRVIGKFKPDQKVTVTYKRDGKESKAEAVLDKRPDEVITFGTTPLDMFLPFGDGDGPKRLQEFRLQIPGAPPGSRWQFNGPIISQLAAPFKLGASIQDTEDGKGVKVLDVDKGSAAENAGIMKDDIIIEVEGKAVNDVDAVAKIIRESRDKNILAFKINRNGKTINTEVKVPRKLKTVEL